MPELTGITLREDQQKRKKQRNRHSEPKQTFRQPEVRKYQQSWTTGSAPAEVFETSVSYEKVRALFKKYALLGDELRERNREKPTGLLESTDVIVGRPDILSAADREPSATNSKVLLISFIQFKWDIGAFIEERPKCHVLEQTLHS